VRSTSLFLILCGACKQENTFSEQQGSDTWLQAANDKVDILFVVDESSSMEDEQATLAQGFSSFAGQLEESATNFHLGVITTSFEYDDPERGKLLGDPLFLTPDTPDYASLFAERAPVGIDGSDKEKGLEAAAYALSPIANLDLNGGFVRNDARLLVVYVSDEEDCSDEGALTGLDQEHCYIDTNLLVPVADYVEAMREMKDADEDVQAASIIGIEGDVCQNVYPSARYRQMAQLLGGQVGDICDGDWSQMLTQLGLNASGVFRSFQLSDAATPETLEVFVDDEPVAPGAQNGWTYEPSTWYLTFHGSAVPPRGTVIVANYTILPGQPRPPGQL
jgi:hypothetical protein